MFRKIVVLVTALIILSVINFAIYDKEQHLANGQLVLLKLAPVDPRSLMQGDYMALDYQISQAIRTQLGEPDQQVEPEKDGFVIVELDDNQVAHFVAIDQGQETTTGQVKLQYRIRHGRVKFATNAYYFEEGTGDKYQDAVYGAMKVAQNGEILLDYLVTEDFVKI